MQSTFLYQRCYHVRVKGLCRLQLGFSMLSELSGCCLQQWSLAVSLWRATYRLGNSLGCLRIPMGHFWPRAWVDVTQSQYWKLHLVIVGTLSPSVKWRQFHSNQLHVCMYFRKLLYSVFILPLKWSLILAVSSCIPSLVLLFPPNRDWPYLTLFFLSLPIISITICNYPILSF